VRRVTAARTFLVEGYVPDATRDVVLESLGRLARDVGLNVLGTAVVADDETLLSIVEATSARAVESAYGKARVPFERIVEAVWVAADERKA
jgi:hypothetical protein